MKKKLYTMDSSLRNDALKKIKFNIKTAKCSICKQKIKISDNVGGFVPNKKGISVICNKTECMMVARIKDFMDD